MFTISRKGFRLAALSGLLGLAGCATNLEVESFDGAVAMRTGLTHVLPFTQYKATITWRVTECIAPTTTEPGRIKIITKVELADGLADDMTQAYLIDPTKMDSALSISSFRVTYFEGRNQIETINAASEDRTAQVIAATAAGLGKLVLAGAAPGAAPADGVPALQPQACNEDTRKAVTAIAAMEADLATAAGRVKQAQARLKTATDKVATMGAAMDNTSSKELAAAIDAVTTETRAQTAKGAELAEQMLQISRTEIVYWPEASHRFQSETGLALPDETLDRWGVAIGQRPSRHSRENRGLLRDRSAWLLWPASAS